MSQIARARSSLQFLWTIPASCLTILSEVYLNKQRGAARHSVLFNSVWGQFYFFFHGKEENVSQPKYKGQDDILLLAQWSNILGKLYLAIYVFHTGNEIPRLSQTISYTCLTLQALLWSSHSIFTCWFR